MADTKLTDLGTVSTLADGDLVYVVDVDDATDSVDGSSRAITTANLSATLPFTQTGTGAVATTVDAKLNEFLNVRDFGAACDGVTDDAAAIQAGIDAAEVIVASGLSATLVMDGDCIIASTITVQVNSSRIPNIDFKGVLHYTGVDTTPAVVIGEVAEYFTGAYINISIVNDNQSDWTESECIGIRLICPQACASITIQQASNFTTGVELAGNTNGLVHNNFILGAFKNNKYGLDGIPSNVGWVNQNLFLGGQFGVDTAVNATLARYAVRLGRSAATNPVNGNLFLAQSFEMNETDTGAGLTFGITLENSINNHFTNIRSEDTEIVIVLDATSIENEVIIAYADINSKEVTDSGPAGSVVQYSRLRHEYAAKVIFDAQDLASRAGLTSFSRGTISGLLGAHTTTGALTYYGPDLTIGGEDIIITHATQALGVMVDTSEQKAFTFVGSYTGTGGRLYVQCYDASDVLITTAGSAVGTSNATLSAVGNGFGSGSDSTESRSVRFTTAVKRAFIGLRKGTGNPQLNGFRILATDDVNYVSKAPILSKSPLHSLNPSFRYGDQAPATGTWQHGDMIWDYEPAASGKMGWVCTAAGTFSAASDVTGDTDGSTAVITGLADTSDFLVGEYVTVSAGMPSVSTPYQILTTTSTTLTLATNSNSSQTDVTIVTVDPVFKTFGDITA